MALPPFLGWGTFSIEDNGMSCAPTWKQPKDFPYNIYLFTAGFFFPLFIIIMTGIRILFIVQKVSSDISTLFYVIMSAAYEWYTRWDTEGRGKEKGEENISLPVRFLELR